MLKMRRHFSGGNKRFFLVALTVFLFAVVFAACGKENEPEDKFDNNTSTVSETSRFESNTDNSLFSTTLPQYAFEEEEDVQSTENDTANTTASSGNGNYETENSTVAMPPKANSQQGEWGASVNN